MQHRLFVYGTLKIGCCRHDILKGKFIKNVVTRPKYRMYNTGSFPALVTDDNNGLAIIGELWEVSDVMLSYLDMIEGVRHNLYARCSIELEDDASAICYIWQRDVSGMNDCGNIWVE